MPAYDKADIQRRMHGAIEAMKHDLGGLRTGRASTALLDPIHVEVYGANMPLNQVATVSAPEPRLLSVQVWDRSNVGPVEKAIRLAGLGINPVTDGQNIRLHRNRSILKNRLRGGHFVDRQILDGQVVSTDDGINWRQPSQVRQRVADVGGVAIGEE